jgi:predicted DNA-binding transcriptional regulator AlpA
MEMFVDRLLDQRPAAEILGISARTLERHRIAGTGPRFCRLGRLVRYRECDLDDWVSRSLRTSTSEIPESAAETAKLTSVAQRDSSAGMRPSANHGKCWRRVARE